MNFIKIFAFFASASVLPGCSGYNRELIIITSDVKESGTNSDILVTEFDQSSGQEKGSTRMGTLAGRGSVNRVHYSVGSNRADKSDVMIQLAILGGDALLMDRVELDWHKPFPGIDERLGDWGSINKYGWCLSNDPSDATNFGRENYGGTCGATICFKTGGDWHRGPCRCHGWNGVSSITPCSMHQSQGKHDECVCSRNDVEDTFAAPSDNFLRGNTNEE